MAERSTDSDVAALDDRNLSAFQPIRLRKVADEVVAVLVDAIRGGLYQPGDMLPRERDLAAQLEVARVTVNEAISRLEHARIVSVRRGNAGGITVRTRSIPPNVVGWDAHGTTANLRALLESRRLLESTTAVLAGERGEGVEMAELERLVDLFDETAESPDEAVAVDLQFHYKIAAMSRSPMIEESTRSTLNALASARAQFPVGRTSPDADLGRRLQREALEALKSRDPERIARVIDEHLASLERQFLGETLSGFPLPNKSAS